MLASALSSRAFASVASGGVARVTSVCASRRVARVVVRAASADPVPASEAKSLAGEARAPKRKSFGETMGFGGWAPEVINGRVAQLAFVSGVGAELATGETLPTQFHDHVFALAFASSLVAFASFIPSVQAKKYTAEPDSKGAFGPFSPGKEMLHGRLAMLGLAAAFYLELPRGAPLFAR